ncbi:F0F1 ATP synthase subunit gamma [Gallaecimonas kandeliae]|uniref:F0F1 ATP synthase subunit gamma n=1 Tax=Gallaecimonas kandeliae TaxID=3029055 RepID=UPI0026485347|nr:F0F1 ATP synthase subunit gamma [Gallaecimonas kandeliae]WKE64215.1 F0F1 ATP synthase subunit gamma [Gallaecimonas kandeliae]
MTRRQELERHRQGLADIREIMSAMKTLAQMESHKLVPLLAAQEAQLAAITQVAADFLGFHSDCLPLAKGTTPVLLLLGTERGFCGDLNQALVRRLETLAPPPLLVAVGRRLKGLVAGRPELLVALDGASVAEEVPVVLEKLVPALAALQMERGPLALTALFPGCEAPLALLPPFEALRGAKAAFAYPPILQVPPPQFLLELTEQYLFAALNALLYQGLMAENHNRVTHLDGAVRFLDQRAEELGRRCNALRQEEIIEEIEVILLSAASLEEAMVGREKPAEEGAHVPGSTGPSGGHLG